MTSDDTLSQNANAVKQREWRRRMTPEQREVFLAKRRKRFAEVGLFEQRERRAKNPDLSTGYAKAWYHRNAERARRIQKEYRDRIKAEVFAAYGGMCVCCGEAEIEFLSLDHIEPLFRQERSRQGSAFYVKVKNAGFPAGLQILCFNCNLAKRTNPECPHARKYLKLVTTVEDPVVGLQRRS